MGSRGARVASRGASSHIGKWRAREAEAISYRRREDSVERHQIVAEEVTRMRIWTATGQTAIGTSRMD